MNIRTENQPTKDSYRKRIEDIEAEIKASAYTKMAAGEYGKSRVQEGELWIAVKRNEIKRLENGMSHASETPSTVISCANSYNERAALKARGYRWNPESKSWYKAIATDNVDSEIKALNQI